MIPHGPARWLRPVLLGWAVIAVIAVLRQWPLIPSMHLSDPDDALRMVQVRDLVGGQGWFDLHQYRIAPPDGVVMHWSRLVDAPLAAMILLLRPLLGQPAAELVAAVTVPLLTMLCVMLCLGRLIAHKFDTELVLIGSLLLMLMLPTMAQLAPLRIDHHGWQIVAVVAALGALIAPTPRRAALAGGLALAFGMSVSLELLPFAGLLGGVFALRWWRDPAEWRWLAWYLDALVLGSAGFFLATRGIADLTNYCDAVSPAYLAGLGAIALGVHALALRPGLPRIGLAIGLGVAALAGAVLFLTLAPTCTAGPFARLDPLVRSFWYDNVKEGMPVWRQDWAVMLQMSVPPLVGLGAALLLARRTAERFWQDYALVLAGGIVIALLVSRFSSVTSAMAVLPLAWLVRQTAQRLTATVGVGRKAALAGGLAVALLPGLLLDIAGHARTILDPAPLAAAAGAPTSEANQACSQPGSLAALARQPRGTVIAQLDFGPFILLRTPHRVLATGHHRAAPAMHDSLAAFLAPPGEAQAIVRRRHVDYVLLCPDLVETHMYQDRAPGGLAAQLLAGRGIDWLEPVDLGREAGIMKLWRVRQAGLNSSASPSMQ